MNKNRHRFTIEEIKTIERLYPNHTNREIAQIIGCTVYAINNRAHMMGLKKPIEFVMKTNRTLGKKLADKNLGVRFSKGHIPKNKGKRLSPELYKRCQSSMFKKGHIPTNTLYDGAERIRIDKRGKPFIFIRISLGKWVHKHIMLWEQKYGKNPVNKILYCKDGNTLNCNPENWELLTRAESMERCRHSDETIAMQIAGRDKKMQRIILEDNRDLIDLKRMTNYLKKEINECT